MLRFWDASGLRPCRCPDCHRRWSLVLRRGSPTPPPRTAGLLGAAAAVASQTWAAGLWSAMLRSVVRKQICLSASAEPEAQRLLCRYAARWSRFFSSVTSGTQFRLDGRSQVGQHTRAPAEHARHRLDRTYGVNCNVSGMRRSLAPASMASSRDTNTPERRGYRRRLSGRYTLGSGFVPEDHRTGRRQMNAWQMNAWPTND